MDFPEIWRKSSHSGSTNNCVEVADLTDGRRAVRDSKDQTGGFLGFDPTQWDVFISSIKNGKFGS
jgi:hypothetical protein